MDQPFSSTGEWPEVPPAPTPVRPVAAPLGPEPPIINTDANLIAAATTAPPGSVVASVPVTAVPAATNPAAGPPPAPRVPRATPRPLPPPPVAILTPASESTAVGGPSRGELIWQSPFAIGVAVVILVALTIVTLPLWIVLYRLSGTPNAPVNDIMALCMMLLGGFVAATAAWGFIVEMRAKVRMVDTMARRGDASGPMLLPPLSGSAASVAARVEAQQASLAAAIEASGRLLGSFSAVLKSFGQLWAQIALLVVALALFAGATLLSLH